MKFVISPDSMKGSLPAGESSRLMAEVCRRLFPGCETVLLPGGDGGEGTLDALRTAWGDQARETKCTVRGLMGQPVQAVMLRRGDKAVVESAQAAGLPPPGAEKDIGRADSAGVGDMIRCALDDGAREILVALGGTGCSDGGLGCLRALGASFTDEAGRPVSPGARGMAQVARADFSGLDRRLEEVTLGAVTDVDNPLLGPRGAAYVYGPQKGAKDVAALEAATARFAAVCEAALGRDISNIPGAGAAGGLGAALMGVLGGKRMPGAETVLNEMEFDRRTADADLVLTAEGRMDGQSVRFGKYPAQVAKRACALGVPAVAFVGGRTADADAFWTLGETAVVPIADGPSTLAECMSRAGELLTRAVENTLRVWRMGRGEKGGAVQEEAVTVRVRYHGDVEPLEKWTVGDWIDLRAAETVDMKAGEHRLISLGVSMELPRGYEAHLCPRSSTYKQWGLLLVNGMGIIDESYCGDGDVWRFNALAPRDVHIEKNDRICQFRLMKKMPPIQFEQVERLTAPDRGGFGSTGTR